MDGLDCAAIIEIIVCADLAKGTHKANDRIANTHFTVHGPEPFLHADMFCLLDNGDLIAEKLGLLFASHVDLCHTSRRGIEQEPIPLGNTIGDRQR